MTSQFCPRCGEENSALEITMFGDARRRYHYEECPCPSPHCPFCSKPLDAEGRCTCRDCFMWTVLVPLPDMVGHHRAPRITKSPDAVTGH